MNFGNPGCGIETYYRMLKAYIGIVKPELVVVTYPWSSSRAEMFDPKIGDWNDLFMSVPQGYLLMMIRNQNKDMTMEESMELMGIVMMNAGFMKKAGETCGLEMD